MAQEYWNKEFHGESVDIPHGRVRHQLINAENPFATRSTQEISNKPNTHFRVRVDQVENKITKQQFPYTVAEIGPSVGIVALDNEGKVYLVGQWRYTFEKYSWEIPTGLQKVGEDPLTAAKRELHEETGLEAKRWEDIGTVDNSNGSTKDVGHLFLATDLIHAKANPDPNEVLQVESVCLWEAVELVYENKITESLSIAAILKAVRFLTTRGLQSNRKRQ